MEFATGPVLRATYLNSTGAARCRAGVRGRASTDGLPCSLACEALLKQVLPAVITDDGTRAPATVTGAADRRHGIRPDNPSDAPPDAAGCLADATEDAAYAPPDTTDDASGCPPDATDDASYTPPDTTDDAAYTPPDAAEDIS